jgi:hypothetical protein
MPYQIEGDLLVATPLITSTFFVESVMRSAGKIMTIDIAGCRAADGLDQTAAPA